MLQGNQPIARKRLLQSTSGGRTRNMDSNTSSTPLKRAKKMTGERENKGANECASTPVKKTTRVITESEDAMDCVDNTNLMNECTPRNGETSNLVPALNSAIPTCAQDSTQRNQSGGKSVNGEVTGSSSVNGTVPDEPVNMELTDPKTRSVNPKVACKDKKTPPLHVNVKLLCKGKTGNVSIIPEQGLMEPGGFSHDGKKKIIDVVQQANNGSEQTGNVEGIMEHGAFPHDTKNSKDGVQQPHTGSEQSTQFPVHKKYSVKIKCTQLPSKSPDVTFKKVGPVFAPEGTGDRKELVSGPTKPMKGALQSSKVVSGQSNSSKGDIDVNVQSRKVPICKGSQMTNDSPYNAFSTYSEEIEDRLGRFLHNRQHGILFDTGSNDFSVFYNGTESPQFSDDSSYQMEYPKAVSTPKIGRGQCLTNDTGHQKDKADSFHNTERERALTCPTPPKVRKKMYVHEKGVKQGDQVSAVKPKKKQSVKKTGEHVVKSKKEQSLEKPTEPVPVRVQPSRVAKQKRSMDSYIELSDMEEYSSDQSTVGLSEHEGTVDNSANVSMESPGSSRMKGEGSVNYNARSRSASPCGSSNKRQSSGVKSHSPSRETPCLVKTGINFPSAGRGRKRKQVFSNRPSFVGVNRSQNTEPTDDVNESTDHLNTGPSGTIENDPLTPTIATCVLPTCSMNRAGVYKRAPLHPVPRSLCNLKCVVIGCVLTTVLLSATIYLMVPPNAVDVPKWVNMFAKWFNR